MGTFVLTTFFFSIYIYKATHKYSLKARCVPSGATSSL